MGRTLPGLASKVLPIVLCAVAAVWAHAAVLDHDFWRDDFQHLYEAADLGFARFVAKPHSAHLYPMRNALLYGLYAAFGLDPRPYFVLILGLHALNVGLLFGVLRLASARPAVAVLAAGLWGVAPVATGALGWISALGQVLATTFALLFLFDLQRLAAGRGAWTPGFAVRGCAVLLAGAGSFALGVVFALLAPALAACLLRDPLLRRRSVAGLAPLWLLVPLLYAWAGAAASGQLPRPDAGLQVPGLTLRLWVHGCGELLGVGRLPGVVDPWVAGAGGLLIAAAALRARASERLPLAAWLALSVVLYGTVALGRVQLALDQALGVEWVVTRPRYHYAGTLGLTLLLTAAARTALRAAPVPAPAGQTAGWRALAGSPVAAALAVGLLAWSARGVEPLHDRVGEGRAARAEIERLVERFRRSAETAEPGAPASLANGDFRWVNRTVRRTAHFPGWVAVFVLTSGVHGIDDAALRFVEPDPRLVAAFRDQPFRRTGRLLLTVGEARDARSGAAD